MTQLIDAVREGASVPAGALPFLKLVFLFESM